MKKLLGVLVGLYAGVAFAGDYHISVTLRCTECHTMHASRQHGLTTEAFTPAFQAITGGPNRNLLLNDGTNATCLACHDQQAAYPDVLGVNGGMVGAEMRSAGSLNAAASSGFTSAGYEHWMGHTLGSDLVPPGFVGLYEPTPQENFNCANCHAVHGSAAFRNLGLSIYMGLPGQSGAAGNPFGPVGPTYNMRNEILTNTIGAAGREASAAGDDVVVNGAGRVYETANISFQVNGANGSGMNSYCAVCHGNFHGDANTRDLIGGVDFVRHPTSGVTRSVAATPLLTGAQTDVVRPAWAAAVGGDFQAACLSCHKGHGNQRGYGLLYPAVDGSVATDWEEGNGPDGELRNLCITCHAQGRNFVP